MTDEITLPVLSDSPALDAGTVELPNVHLREYPISQIKMGHRHRQELGKIDELATSIADVGLLHPIPVRPDGLLIAGQRRLAACKKLGWQSVPVHVVDLAEIARGEFAENAFRKPFLPTEIYAIWRALEPIERAAAQESQKATRFGSGGGKLPAPGKGRTRDKIAKFAGISGRTVDKISAVMKAAEADAHFIPFVEKMDRTGQVNGVIVSFARLNRGNGCVKNPRHCLNRDRTGRSLPIRDGGTMCKPWTRLERHRIRR